MKLLTAAALTAALLVNTGCRRNLPDKTDVSADDILPPDQAVSVQNRQASAESSAMPRFRPEQAAARHADAPRSTSSAATAGSRNTEQINPSIPESPEQASDLMQLINNDIRQRNFAPDVARRFRASFRGRLLAAQIPPEEIKAWVEGR